MSCAAIIVAAGTSRRMGFDKLAADLCGEPVLHRTVSAFADCPAIDLVVVVCPDERFRALLAGPFAKPLLRVDGGEHRQISVQNGLAALPPDCGLVAVHDGARPLVSQDAISETLDAAKQYGAAVLARPVTETIKRSSPEEFTRAGIDRSYLWFMETPQAFRTQVLRRAFAAVTQRRLTVTDEVSAVEVIGISAKLIHSRAMNLKITTPSDLELAAAFLR